MKVIRSLATAAWFGGSLFLAAVAAPAAFAASPTGGIAGDVVGSMLMRWHYAAIAIPLLLLVAELRRPSAKLRAVVLVVGLLAASGEALVDLKARQVRESSAVPMSLLPAWSSTRRTFGRLHGISMSLLLLQILAAAGTVGGDAPERD